MVSVGGGDLINYVLVWLALVRKFGKEKNGGDC